MRPLLRSKRHWQRSSTTTNICGMTLAPRPSWLRSIERSRSPRTTKIASWRARDRGPLRSAAEEAQQQGGRQDGRRCQICSEGHVRQKERQAHQARQRQEDPRFGVEAHLPGGQRRLRPEAMPLFQLINGVRSGRQVQVQALVHDMWGSSPYGGQSLNFCGRLGPRGSYGNE